MNIKNWPVRLIGVVMSFSFFLVNTGCESTTPPAAHTTWSHYGGSSDQSRYFEAPEITKENVNQLAVAWSYPSGDSLPYFFSPIVVDTMMYLLAKNSSLVAINARTGREIWIHANLHGITRRGINYWESKDGKDRRLVFTLNHSLQVIDALTGQSITSFGEEGYVDLRQGLEREPSSIRRIQAMMPGVIFDNLVIVGSAPGEAYFSPPGYVRAYNVVTGQLAWTFRTIPQPGDYGYETWPKDAYKYAGGVNVWSEMSVDEQRGIVFLPLGSPTYDYYGADRPGNNLFGNSLVALDARTGKRLWHFQTVHHDLWDYDLASAPQLVTLNRNGKKVDAVSIATKNGFVFVFDRETGEPVFPFEEKSFPASEMPGEKASPTQPIPSLPAFVRHEVTREILNPYFPDTVKQHWYRRLDAARSGLYVPPSNKYETVIMPGPLGGANYGNTAANPHKGMLYILAQEHASVYKLEKVGAQQPTLSGDEVKKAKALYASSCQGCHGANFGGGAGPALVKVGERVFFDEFKSIVTNGRGQMPGFIHVDEQSLTALYRYLGGNPARVNFLRQADTSKKIDGPVIAKGGVKIKPDARKAAPMMEYPEGVPHPNDQYTTDYGLDWPALLSPPWSFLVAYDLNTGTIKWKQPVGEDSVLAKGDKTKGTPSGVLRKGMVVTSTGLVFATAKGGKLYALDEDNGNILWETTLSHESNAQPTMFTLDGKQFLVINATGNFSKDGYNHSRQPGALAKGYVVYALPGKNDDR